MSPYHIAANLLFLFFFLWEGESGAFFKFFIREKPAFTFLLFLNKDVLYFFLWDLNLCAKKGGYNNDVISTAICC